MDPGSQRLMNDSTLPPSSTMGINRSVNSSSSSSSSASQQRLTRAAAPAFPVVRRQRKKGFGLHDWVRLLKSAKDLAQRKGQPLHPFTKEEVKQHSTAHDGWIILHGKVYNISPYLHYHPGGIEILQNCLGKDATSLFEKYHPWVNIDGLIGPLLLGFLDDGKKPNAPARKNHGSTSSSALNDNIMHAPPPKLPVSLIRRQDGSEEMLMPAPQPPSKMTLPSLLSTPSYSNVPDAHAPNERDVNPWEKEEMT